ncbi:MAG: hypothetical protein V7K40_02665 [Nostoc sp.]
MSFVGSVLQLLILLNHNDKHPAYDLAYGSSGKGIDKFYAPEMNAKVALKMAN